MTYPVSDVEIHPELVSEQQYLDAAYDRVEELKAMARAAVDDVMDIGKGGTFQARTERDMVVRANLARLEQLEIGSQPLCFGRIDEVEGDRFYIGRLGVSGADQEPLVVDWRAPVAEPFYRATGRFPMGLARRRHYALRGRKLLSIEDEPMTLEGSEELPVTGQGALLAALERTRSGRMQDIVATIQGEQDEIIRSPLPGVQVVQGGPGTGKTAVALHRAAYLLYTHRFPLELQGVLVVGPNPVFLRYIGQVLPSLGETGVTLSTIAGVYPDAVATGTDTPATAAVKGDARMSDFVYRAVISRERPLKREVDVPFGSYRLRITPGDTEHIIRTVKKRTGTHNQRRRRVERMLFETLFNKYNAAIERVRAIDPSAAGSEFADFAEAMRAHDGVVEALDRMWPRLRAEELLHDLYGAKPLIRLAAKDIFTDDEAALLLRPRSETLEDIPWTAGDVALLDEARVLLGPLKPPPEDKPFVTTYGHVVVDEAQDLSPMQLRMLGRRCLGGSLTMVGDIAQATGSWAPSSWAEVVANLPQNWDFREVELTIGYRTPAEAMLLAAPVLAETGLGLTPPRPVRSSETDPLFVRSTSYDLFDDVVTQTQKALTEESGTIAVLVPRTNYAEFEAALTKAEVSFGSVESKALDQRVSLLSAEDAKGLEFDNVIVVEPTLIVNESVHGLRALYVALTRTTLNLAIIHSQDLPNYLHPAASL